MSRAIRIGTRASELAQWQAKTVQGVLEKAGHKTLLIPVKSEGDINLEKPLYEMGITGIFTKSLDISMLMGEIDIAVHSMKDVPTKMPKGIVEAAVLKRESPKDILVHKGLGFLEGKGCIATGSLRRKAQWLNKYPNHQVVNLRGNVNSRLKKLEENEAWNGAVFASAGLERIGLKPENAIDLDWMLPAPAQGAMLVVAKEGDDFCLDALSKLNHRETEICVHIERGFLRVLEGGCTAPIGALANIEENKIHFEGALFGLEGKKEIRYQKSFPIEEAKGAGKKAAEHVLENGGRKLMKEIKQQMDKNQSGFLGRDAGTGPA